MNSKLSQITVSALDLPKNDNQNNFIKENNSIPIAEQLRQFWLNKLSESCPSLSYQTKKAIVGWLLGSEINKFENLATKELNIATSSMEYRWKILNQRYLGVSPEKGYYNLIRRLGNLVALRNKIQTWISLSRDRQRKMLDILSEVLQELLLRDVYMQQQMSYIATVAKDSKLNNALLLASLEEYCLRPIQNQYLIVHRFITYVVRIERGGLIKVPRSKVIRFVSPDIPTEDNENSFSLLDQEAVVKYHEKLEQKEQEDLCYEVQVNFIKYLQVNLGEESVQWLQMYLKNKTPSEIAVKLNKPVREIYQLREKVKYHAVFVFQKKEQSELIQEWLKI
jgi:hypothetical protein